MSLSIRRLEPHFWVAPQLFPEDVAAARDQGVSLIINNRPDGEAPGQPAAAEIEAAAHEAGIACLHLPVAGAIAADQVAATADAIRDADGTALAFCASGTRSTYLWALARARAGIDGETIIGQAAAVGYDLRPLYRRLSSNGVVTRS